MHSPRQSRAPAPGVPGVPKYIAISCEGHAMKKRLVQTPDSNFEFIGEVHPERRKGQHDRPFRLHATFRTTWVLIRWGAVRFVPTAK